ncbi:MAG: cell division inhibitor MinD [Peptococcaceae bacterium 1109]|nr:MAG: cell division inhibitor MinD [Peptococcaceae bacterium 1109]
MGKVIVITSGKGGVGKTTTTANLGHGLAALGRKVCLVDADIGLRNLDVVLGLENRIVYHLLDVVEGNCTVSKALIRDKQHGENLVLLAAAQTREKDAVNPDQMRDLMKVLRKEYDYVLVDCPAGIEQGFRNAVAGADQAILVTTPEVSAVRDADRIVGLLEATELHDPQVIINRIRPDMVRRGDMLDISDVDDFLRIPILGIVPDDESIIVSTNRGEPVVNDQRSRSGQAYRNICRRLEGQEVSFMDLQGENFMQRLLRRIRVGAANR